MSASLSLASTMRVRDPFNALHTAATIAMATDTTNSMTESGSDCGAMVDSGTAEGETKRRNSTGAGTGFGSGPSPLNNLCSSAPTDVPANHPLLHNPSLSSSTTSSSSSSVAAVQGSATSTPLRTSSKRTISPTLLAPSASPSKSKSPSAIKSPRGQEFGSSHSLPVSFDQPLLSPQRGCSENSGASGTGGSGVDGSVQKRKRRQSFDITQFLPGVDPSSPSGSRVASALLNAYASSDNIRGSPLPPVPTPSTALATEEGVVGMSGISENEGGLIGIGSVATAATDSVVSFCMQRNPWRYTNETPTHVPLHIEQQPGEREKGGKHMIYVCLSVCPYNGPMTPTATHMHPCS